MTKKFRFTLFPTDKNTVGVLYFFVLFTLINMTKISAQNAKPGSWSTTSSEALTAVDNSELEKIALNLSFKHKRLLAFAETTQKIAQLPEIKNAYLSKMHVLCPNLEAAPLEANYDQLLRWLQMHPTELEHYQHILDSIENKLQE